MFHKNRRGYVRTRFTADTLTADFRTLLYVSTPGAPVATAATFVVADGTKRLHPA
jgi:alkaline phosphatase D